MTARWKNASAGIAHYETNYIFYLTDRSRRIPDGGYSQCISPSLAVNTNRLDICLLFFQRFPRLAALPDDVSSVGAPRIASGNSCSMKQMTLPKDILRAFFRHNSAYMAATCLTSSITEDLLQAVNNFSKKCDRPI